MSERFDALAIDSEIQNRMRLKQATSSVSTFGKFYQSATLDEALKKLALPERVDVVFISERLGQDAIPNFVKGAKSSPSGQDAAYVMIVSSQAELGTIVAKSVLLGVDGFLCEPYSVDSLLEITRLASKVKKERSDAREEAAIKFLMSQISEQVSIVAQLKGLGMNPIRESKKLQDMCTIFSSLDDASRERYHRIALDVFENAPIPKPLIKKAYGGASSRVKARMEKKILDKLAAGGGEAEKTAAPTEAAPAPKP